MLYKLSIKNIQKSIKDYTIYFLTLIFGVAVFYMFNSLDSQQAMMEVSKNTRDIIKLMVETLGYISVGVAVVLGFLIVYANNFLIKRRKKEFGLYMTLGMGKSQISKILLFETIWIGLFSLIVGLLIGVFCSQLMSVLVVKLFKADMSKYEFVFSGAALSKTIVCFGVMYGAVMFFNTFTISRYKLIDLLTAVRKNEKIKMKNPIACVFIFLASAVLLGWAYYMVTGNFENIKLNNLWIPILMGIVATFFIFWSLSGFILKVVQSRKGIYLKGNNMFVLRQIHNKINTTVFSITIICLLLFMTISLLSSGLSINRYLTKDLEEMTPVDINLIKQANLSNDKNKKQSNSQWTKEQMKDSHREISQTLKNCNMDMNILRDVVELKYYTVEGLTWERTLDSVFDSISEQYPYLRYETLEQIVKVSDYNRIAKLYGIKEYELKDEEYIVLCDFDSMVEFRNMALQEAPEITINGKTYKSKYDKCQEGYINMGTSHMNTGIYLVPDSCELKDSQIQYYFLAANYNGDTQEEKKEIEKIFADEEESKLLKELKKKSSIGELDGITKIATIESSVGITNIITFIAIYLGFIFLIASAAILALKELTETSDNKQRYGILRKIGMDDSMIHQSLFKQIGIFFLVPLCLAILHSVFGIQFALKLLSVHIKTKDLLPSILATAGFLVIIYGGYFLATFIQSKNMIKD